MGILEARKGLGQPKESAQAQIGVGHLAGPADDRVDAVSGNADRLGQLVLANADFVQEFLFQDLTRMRVVKCGVISSMIVDNLDIAGVPGHPDEADPPLAVDADAHCPARSLASDLSRLPVDSADRPMLREASSCRSLRRPRS